MKTIVPDASVLLKWVLPPDHEQHVEQAMVIRDALFDGKIRLLVPKLWYYDAAYHALAINRDGLFVTADEQYIQKAGSSGHILHLKDWGSPTS